MKNRILFAVGVLAIMLYGCTKEDVFNTYEIDFGETINHNKELELKFSDIEDSRCPSDVICVWEGQADVEFTAYFDSDDSPTVFHLIKRAGFPALADTVLNGYFFRLLEVDPYPEQAGFPPSKEDYTVRLLVEQE